MRNVLTLCAWLTLLAFVGFCWVFVNNTAGKIINRIPTQIEVK